MNRSPQQQPALQHPGQVWSSVSPRVGEPDVSPPDQVPAVGVRLVGVAVLPWPDQVVETELAPVDDLVVARGQHVAVEPGRQRLVRQHLGRRPAAARPSASNGATPRRGRCGHGRRPPVCRRASVHRRSVSKLCCANGGLPVSTGPDRRRSRSPTLANDGTNATPSATSSASPRRRTVGVLDLARAVQRSSATCRMLWLTPRQ